MLTRLVIRNFKQFNEVEIELGNPVVFIGPNNSGKTTALQALALWDVGIRRWTEKRSKDSPKKRSGVAINRRDLLAVPVPDAQLLWRDLHVRDVLRSNGKPKTSNVRVEIIVEGITGTTVWKCGLEFDYANNESFYVRSLLAEDGVSRLPIPEEASAVPISYLPPMSGLSANETRLEQGAIAVRLGEGRTAEVLRNLCFRVVDSDENRWQALVEKMQDLFGCRLDRPVYVAERGEIQMSYQDRGGTTLDLSSSGRGFQQTLLLLAHMSSNPGSVLLLDEPDAHLEVLRQRSLYQTLTTEAKESRCQIIAASHSEVVLNEAADRDVVVAFVGRPHRIDDRGTHLVKSLKEIGFEQYYLAEERGWVLYVEGSTDLAILKAFAARLNHAASTYLNKEDVFVHYIGNQPSRAKSHFYALKEAKPDLVGFIICDQLTRPAEPDSDLDHHNWSRKEIENYLCQPETLEEWAASLGFASLGPLWEKPEAERYRTAMRESIAERVPPVALKDRDDPWWKTVKASDDFLDFVFRAFAKRLRLPESHFRKSDYHKLADFVPLDQIDAEVKQVLDRIHAIASRAVPRT